MSRVDAEALLAELTSAELAGWAAYYEVDPWGRERQDMMLAQIAALIYNVNRKKDAPARAVKDFMPKFAPPKDPATLAQEQAATCLAWVLSVGGTVNGVKSGS